MTDYPKDELAERRINGSINRLAKQIGEHGPAMPDYTASMPSWIAALDSICDRSLYFPPHPRMDLRSAMQLIENTLLPSTNLPAKTKDMLVRWHTLAAKMLGT